MNSNSFTKLFTNICQPPHNYAYIHIDDLSKDMQQISNNSSCPWGRNQVTLGQRSEGRLNLCL